VLGLKGDTILVQDHDASAVTVDEREIVLSVRVGSYFDFNRIGSQIWRMLAAPCRVDQILEVLSQTHDVEIDKMKRDVTLFIEKLIDSSLVRIIVPGDHS
jgi:hypothetical protein